MKSSRRPDVYSQTAQERRKQARAEDEETEGMIRRYMRLAEVALQEPEARPVKRHFAMTKSEFEWPKAG